MMIEGLVINQNFKRLEYAIDKGWIICGKNDECYPAEKLEVYEIMQGVIKNWNENNPTLPLCEKEHLGSM